MTSDHPDSARTCEERLAQKALFEIRPNAAFNDHSWPWLLGGLAVICLAIALRFAWLGYWMILPFAVLDVLLVWGVFRLVLRRGDYIEKVQVDSDWVTVRHVARAGSRRWKFSQPWVRVDLVSPAHRWYPHRLLVGARGQWVEIGTCLTDDERLSLASALRARFREFAERPGGTA